MKKTIYLVNYSHPDFETVSIEEAHQKLLSLAIYEELAADSESTGFYPINSELLFFQIGSKTVQYIIFPADLQAFKDIIENNSLIFHGAKHDLKFLLALNIIPKKIICTNLQELILESGKDILGIALKKSSLANVAKKYLKIDIDKSQRKNLGLDSKSFIYGAKDIMPLKEIQTIQQQRIEANDLKEVLELENRFVIPLAYAENTGFLLNKVDWIKKVDKDNINYKKCYNDLLTLIKEDDRVNHYISFKSDLFSAPEEIIDINLDAPLQVMLLLKCLEIDIVVKDKESIEGKHLVKYKDKEPIIAAYLTYKKIAKKVSTYGQNILDKLEAFPDNRLRTDYKQIITTGRLSSGEEKESKIGINLQNIMKNSIERKYFIASKDHSLIISDYTGQETRILAEFAKDPIYTEFIVNPEKDLHCFLLQCIYPEKYNSYTHAEIAEKFSKKRSWVKPGTFSMPYGGVGKTIADNLGIPQELGEAAYNRFMAAFPGLTRYYAETEKAALLNGYILTNNITKRRIYLPQYDHYKKLCTLKYLTKDQYKEKKRYESSKGRLARNYPIQSTASDQLKTAAIYYFNWIVTNNYFNIIKIVAFVHDEIIVEAPNELAELARVKLDSAMVKAGKVFCPNIPIYTTNRIANYWLEEKH